MTSPRPAAGDRPNVLADGVEYRWVHLWHWPIRTMHWIAALCIAVLVVTGFYIGRPYFVTSGEAIDHFLMGRMRFLHLTAAAVLVGTGIVRFYWLFAGNRFERWSALFPVTRKSWLGLARTIGYYLMLPGSRHRHYLGHNPLQQWAYTAVYGVAIVQVATGFALYGLANPGGFFHTTFGWLGEIRGFGLSGVRLVHHALTWVILTFIPVHVYLGVRAEVLDREGTMSSIFSGGRWVPAGERFEDE